MFMLDPLDFLSRPAPAPGRASARMEIVTGGGNTIGLLMQDIKITYDDGRCMAEIEDADRTWHGEGGSQAAAIIALLADRSGYRAVVTCKEDG